MSSNMQIPKICQDCGEQFIAKTTVTKYCGLICAQRAYKKRARKEKMELVDSIPRAMRQTKLSQLGDKEFLSLIETSVLLGASRMTIYRQIRAGTINVIRLGRRTIIPRSEIEKLITS